MPVRDPGLHPDWVHDCDFMREWNGELYHRIQCLREVILEVDLAYLVVDCAGQRYFVLFFEDGLVA